MKKLFTVSIIFCFVLTTLFAFNLGFVDTVKAEEFTDIVLCEWDGVASGLDDGTDDNITWVNLDTADNFETSSSFDLTPDNSFKIWIESESWMDAYWNLDLNFDYIKSINLSYYVDFSNSATLLVDFRNNGVTIIRFRMGNIAGEYIEWYNGTDWEQIYNGWLFQEQAYLIFTHNATNVFNIQILNETFDVQADVNTTTFSALEWETFDSVHFTKASAQQGNDLRIYFDNFYITTTGETTAKTEGDIYFKFFNKETGEPLSFKGVDLPDSIMQTNDFINGTIYSSITTDGLRDSYSLTDTMPMTVNFTDGDTISFTITDDGNANFLCRVGGIYKYFTKLTIPLKIYHGQTYNIYLEPADYTDGVDYINCGDDLTDWGAYVCLNKNTYDIDETIRLEYKLPPANWLFDNNYAPTGYELRVYNKDDYFFGLRLTGLIKTPHVIAYSQDDGNLILDGNRHILEIPVTEDINEYGFDNFYNDYEIVIETFDSGWGQGWKLIENVQFFVSGEDFEANGTIDSIAPNPCYFGQDVTFAWTSNSVGRIEINYPSGDTYFSVAYGYSDGTHTLTRTMTGIGIFSVELYSYGAEVSNITLPIDTDTLRVNALGENGSFGTYGFGVSYLYIPNYRVIAGYDTVQIYYRTYKNDSILNITSPRGETTYFSTTVSNQSDNVLNIAIPNYMQIGTWNVTLDGGDINGVSKRLTTSFNIVNEENNWIEFSKHVFYSDEPFSIFIKHSYRIALTFYKDNIAQGETIIYDTGENDNALVVIPTTIIPVSAGNWRVEMWRINDRNQIYELAQWECTVSATALTIGDQDTDILAILQANIPYWDFLAPIFGLIICILFTLIPFIITTRLKERHVSVQIPNLLYGIMFGTGVITSTIFGLFGLEVAFFLLALLIGIIVLIYFMGFKASSVKEE